MSRRGVKPTPRALSAAEAVRASVRVLSGVPAALPHARPGTRDSTPKPAWMLRHSDQDTACTSDHWLLIPGVTCGMSCCTGARRMLGPGLAPGVPVGVCSRPT